MDATPTSRHPTRDSSATGTRHAVRPLLLAGIPERLAATTADAGTAAEERDAAAETFAAELLAAGASRAVDVERLVGLADEVGLDALEEVWRQADPATLPGALRVLYLLRSSAQAQPAILARLAAAGRGHAEVSATVAGLPAYPSPTDVCRLVDDLLREALARDLPAALHRAAALCRVLAAGRGATDPPDPDARAVDGPDGDAVLGLRLLSTATALDAAAGAAGTPESTP